MTVSDADRRLAHLCQKLDGRQAEGLVKLNTASARFVADVVERWAKAPFVFTVKQAAWIEQLEEDYLG